MWVKICGLTKLGNAARIAEYQPDAIGLNFYPKSARFITVDAAKLICEQLPEHIESVGLFVNETVQNILEICQTCSLKTIQLHGNETAEMMANLQKHVPHIEIIKAFRYGSGKLASLAELYNACLQQDMRLKAFLIDAGVPGKFGGTGQQLPWSELSKNYDFVHWPPLILAGGLNHQNVKSAIQQSHAWGVDTASGVELETGIKDPNLVQQFIMNARSAMPH